MERTSKKDKLRAQLSTPGLLKTARNGLSFLNEHNSSKNTPTKISTLDCAMSALAMFSLKYPSLLQFDKDRQKQDEVLQRNLSTLYGVPQAPCDTYMRERLDFEKLDSGHFSKPFNQLFRSLKDGKILQDFEYLDGYHLVSGDATGYFSSSSVKCENCCEKHSKKTSVTTYYHQMLQAAIVHPEQKTVIPFAPEPIVKQDGKTKNDCERNGAKRLWSAIRKSHPKLRMIAIEDALYANAPHLDLLGSLGIRYIIGVKPKDHTWLFDWVAHANCEEHEYVDDKGTQHKFSFINKVPLNESRDDVLVNFIEYWEETAKGKKLHFTWVTDFSVTKDNVYQLMRGGRARWKIENETFNTLKNQGYSYEHNFGHGDHHLSTVFANLTMLAFFIDQIQQMCCYLFQAAHEESGSKIKLWETIRNLFQWFFIESWLDLYQAITHPKGRPLVLDSS
jgi:hypothetical protein